MSAFLSGSEKGLPVGCMLHGGIHDTQNLLELAAPPPPPPRGSSKPFRGRTPHSLPVRFRLLNLCRLGQRTRQGATASLLLQPSSEMSRGEVSKDGEVDLRMVSTSRKLRPYFQAHTVEVPTEYPMKQILHKPETSGRLIKWAIELSEFDIRYKPRAAVKGQILADFIMEFTPAESTEATQLTPDLPIWILSVDGAANDQARGAGLILTSLDGIDVEYALRFGFQASNNKPPWKQISWK